MRINRNTRRSARPVFRSVNSSRRRAVNKRTLNSGRNYGTYCTFKILDFPSFEIDTDRDAAIDYMNTHTFADIPVKVDDIYEDHNTYRVHLTYDMDEETGFNAWVSKQNAESPIMDVDETTIYSLIYSVLKNWARIKFDKQWPKTRAKLYGNDVNSARRRNMNCSANNNVVYYADLNKAQKDYVLANWEKWSEMEWLWDIFYENEADTPDAKPERAWVDDMLDALSYDDIATFEIVDDKTVVPEKKAPDNFNTYVNYLNSNRRRNGRHALNSARSLELLTFNELNDAQKQSAIEGIWNTKGADWVYETFNEMTMEVYKDDIKQLAAECEASIDTILGDNKEAYWEIDTDKLYWNSSSQGPYPEWHLNEVFGGLTITYLNPAHIVSNYSPSQDGKPAVESVDLVWDYYSKAQDANDFTIDIEYFDPVEGDWYGDYGIDPADPTYGIPAEIQEKIKNIVNVLQHFLDTAWSYVHEVCSDYPDDEYAYDLYEANDWGDFEVIDDQTAEYFNDEWDDEIAGVDYY